MGKVQILAVLTMDGCLSSELYYKAHQDLCLDRCGLDEIIQQYHRRTFILNPQTRTNCRFAKRKRIAHACQVNVGR